MEGAGNRGARSGVVCVFALALGSQALAQGGLTWQQLGSANNPSARRHHAMVYDAARGRIVLFGGLDASGPQSDTWEWDGVNWTQATPAHNPPARLLHAMAYDSLQQRVVLFGGAPSEFLPQPFGDTWVWDGVDWTQVMPAQSPTLRYRHSLAYDEARQRVVLFGGQSPNGLPMNDTWEWDGVNWTQANTVQIPNPSVGHDMVYDSARQRVVLFGRGTWEWDGVNWMQLSSAQIPTVFDHHAMAFHAARRRTVLFGGVRFAPLSDTWEWDGVNWTEAMPSLSPSARAYHAMAYDPARRTVVLFGGQMVARTLSDTWECASLSPASFTPIGTGCGGSAGTTALDAAQFSLPWTGDTYSIELSNLPPGNMTFMVTGLSNTFWTGALIRLPASLISWGMPGCTAYTDVVHSELLSNTTGMATWTKTVPNDARLIGLTFYNQGFIIDPGVNAMGAIVSNAGESVVGMR